jgi:hypothetical protein
MPVVAGSDGPTWGGRGRAPASPRKSGGLGAHFVRSQPPSPTIWNYCMCVGQRTRQQGGWPPEDPPRRPSTVRIHSPWTERSRRGHTSIGGGEPVGERPPVSMGPGTVCSADSAAAVTGSPRTDCASCLRPRAGRRWGGTGAGVRLPLLPAPRLRRQTRIGRGWPSHLHHGEYRSRKAQIDVQVQHQNS